jgi:hypothetical protein
MECRKVKKLRRDLEAYRSQRGITSRELQSLARRLLRDRDPSRGKHRMWLSTVRRAWPIAIPDHPGDLNRFTAQGILDVLEEDLEYFERTCEEEFGEEGEP